MNTLIKDLAEEANIGWDEKYQWYVGNTQLETFARLIIEKCLDQCYYRGMNDSLYEGQLRAADNIKEYFGIIDIDTKLRERSTYFGNDI